jgi:hypothetical protein
VTPEDAEDAWLRYLMRVGPKIDGAVLRWIANQLAGDTEPGELHAISADLVAIAAVVIEEAEMPKPIESSVDRIETDWPPAFAPAPMLYPVA